MKKWTKIKAWGKKMWAKEYVFWPIAAIIILLYMIIMCVLLPIIAILSVPAALHELTVEVFIKGNIKGSEGLFHL